MPRCKMPKMVQNVKIWCKFVQNAPKSRTFRSLAPAGPDTKRHKMARFWGTKKPNRRALPVFAMKTAGYRGIDRRTMIVAMRGSNEPPVKGPGPPQGAFVPYSFPARNESSRPVSLRTLENPCRHPAGQSHLQRRHPGDHQPSFSPQRESRALSHIKIRGTMQEWSTPDRSPWLRGEASCVSRPSSPTSLN